MYFRKCVESAWSRLGGAFKECGLILCEVFRFGQLVNDLVYSNGDVYVDRCWDTLVMKGIGKLT